VITPVTVLTGFLGSGKTTLLNRLVSDPRFADSAVIVNELGDVPIDHLLVRRASESIVVLPGGCICCRASGDLIRALRELHRERASGAIGPFRRVVIETTGLADPAPILAALIELPVLAARYSLAGVVATADAEHGMAALDAHPEAVKQLALADRIVITKIDRADADALEARLRALNPGAKIVRASHGNLDPALLFETGLHRPGLAAPDATGWLAEGAYRRVGEPRASPHDPRISSFAWRAREPVAWEDFERGLETLLELMGAKILRLKGLVSVAGEPGPRAVHAVQHALYPPARLAAWPDADHDTRIVVIGRDLEEAAAARILDSFTRTSAISPR
ncbi:MAG TPA: GTP-binding protein, partial [Usitatibacter sp.]